MTVTKSFATLLFQISMKREFNLGNLAFEHILRHVENLACQKALGYPSLIYEKLTTQKPDLVTATKIVGPPIVEMRISHKLYEGHHLRDVPYGKKMSSQTK